jgi:hypothetical protein
MSRPNDDYKIVQWIHTRLPDKRAFFEHAGYKPHAGQEQIHAALESSDLVICAAGVRCGKTMAAGMEMYLESMLPRKEFVGWTVAPTKELADIVFDAVTQYLRDHFRSQPNLLIERRTDGELSFPNLGGGRSRIFRKTTFDAQGKGKLTGQAVDFMIVDEAAKILHDSIWYNELATRLVDRGGKALLISSPMGQGGFFATLWHDARMAESDSISLRMPSWTNIHVPAKVWAKLRLKTPERAWRQEYAAEFISQEGNVFDEAQIARNSRGRFEDPIQGAIYYAGVDLAMVDDYTVCTILRDTPEGPKLVRALRMRKVGQDEQVRRVAALLKPYGNAPTYVDATSIGRPFVQAFMKAGVEVRPVVWSAPKKSDMTRNMMLLVERGLITFPQRDLFPELYRELTQYRWKQTGGYEIGEAPPGQNDDIVSALLMACQWFKGKVMTEGMSIADLKDAERHIADQKNRPLVNGIEEEDEEAAEDRAEDRRLNTQQAPSFYTSQRGGLGSLTRGGGPLGFRNSF